MSSYLRTQFIGLLVVELIGAIAFYGKQRWVAGLFIVAFVVTAIVAFIYDRRKHVEFDEDV